MDDPAGNSIADAVVRVAAAVAAAVALQAAPPSRDLHHIMLIASLFIYY